jgi:hypothetical protein
MEIIELRSAETGEMNEEIFAKQVTNPSHAVVMLHFIG